MLVILDEFKKGLHFERDGVLSPPNETMNGWQMALATQNVRTP